MTPSELRSLGEPFPGWQSRLARCLKVNPRTVRSWASGRSRITPQMERLIRQEFEAGLVEKQETISGKDNKE